MITIKGELHYPHNFYDYCGFFLNFDNYDIVYYPTVCYNKISFKGCY